MMAKAQRVGLDEVIGYFDTLEDPREAVNRKHPLVSVVVIAMMAVLAGAGGPTAIARWAAPKEAFVRAALPLPHGNRGRMSFGACCRCCGPRRFRHASGRGRSRCGPKLRQRQ